MPKSYPPLTPQEVIKILEVWGLTFDRQQGSHAQYEGIIKGKKVLVTVDMGYSEFNDPRRIKTMIRQSNLSREEFYGATRATAKKIGLRKLKGMPNVD